MVDNHHFENHLYPSNFYAIIICTTMLHCDMRVQLPKLAKLAYRPVYSRNTTVLTLTRLIGVGVNIQVVDSSNSTIAAAVHAIQIIKG